MPDEIRTAKVMPPPEVFSLPVILCPNCRHGIDPHGLNPGSDCGMGDENGIRCTCLWSPNDIAAVLISEAAEKERTRLRDLAASATITRQEDGLAALKIEDPHGLYWTPVSTHLIEALVEERNEDTKRIQFDLVQRMLAAWSNDWRDIAFNKAHDDLTPSQRFAKWMKSWPRDEA